MRQDNDTEGVALLRARIELLSAALLRYGRHLETCDRVRLLSEQCTCGLERALALGRLDDDALAAK